MASQPTDNVPNSADDTELRTARRGRNDPLLVEIAWEVCNQLGGIYTVLRSKAPSLVDHWGAHYFLVGPYNPATATVEFEPTHPTGPVGNAVKQLREMGIGAHFGRWLVTGRPYVVLLDYRDLMPRLAEIKYRLWKDHGISTPANDSLVNDTVAFGEAARMFLSLLANKDAGRRKIIAHFHEWMAGVAIPMLRHENWPGAVVFTTHATLLGRYLAMSDGEFYHKLNFYNPDAEAKRFNVEAQYRIERASAHGAHVFTTVSDITGDECRALLGRAPDVYLPNGLNIQRFAAIHEFQNLHRVYKEKIHNFVMGHFFPSYNFDLDKTLYFFTSGRYEYRNKGMDITVEALARLNYRLKCAGSPLTVVTFIVTRRPYRSINVSTLQSHAMLDEIKTVTEAIKEQLGQPLFQSIAGGKIPDLNALVDEYWMLRLRRTIHAWKRDQLPSVVTHDLVDDQKDELLNQIRRCQLFNHKHDPVKIIYHPEFINPTNPLFGMEYDQFVRGCHMGIFPSYYEPWGYTPLESIALGVPAVTSDLAGFGTYIRKHDHLFNDQPLARGDGTVIGATNPHHESKGIYLIDRRYTSYDQAADALADRLFRFCSLTQRERINLRNRVESVSSLFDWHNLGKCYHEAHNLALEAITEK